MSNKIVCIYVCILQADGEDELKKRQLMELAIINGTYRDSESMRALAAAGKYRTGVRACYTHISDARINSAYILYTQPATKNGDVWR